MRIRASGIRPAIRWLSLVGIIWSPSPWMISVGQRIPVRRCSAPWSGMSHSTIASYWASRAARLVGVSRFSPRAMKRPRNSAPSPRLVSVGAKKMCSRLSAVDGSRRNQGGLIGRGLAIAGRGRNPCRHLEGPLGGGQRHVCREPTTCSEVGNDTRRRDRRRGPVGELPAGAEAKALTPAAGRRGTRRSTGCSTRACGSLQAKAAVWVPSARWMHRCYCAAPWRRGSRRGTIRLSKTEMRPRRVGHARALPLDHRPASQYLLPGHRALDDPERTRPRCDRSPRTQPTRVTSPESSRTTTKSKSCKHCPLRRKE